jgi:hypothetical protein
MTPEKMEKLISIAPYMFQYNGCDNPQISLLCFGFECDDGWFDLLRNLILEIKKIDTQKQCKVFQVKEKYGTLRFYTIEYNKYIQYLIDRAENQSSEICEICGEKGHLRSNPYGWLKTLCDNCYTKELN